MFSQLEYSYFPNTINKLTIPLFSLPRSPIDPDLTDDEDHEDRSTDSTDSMENDFGNLAKHPNKNQSEEKLDKLDKAPQKPKVPPPRKAGHNEADKRSRPLIKRTPSETSMTAQLEQATEYVYQPEDRFGVDEHGQVDVGGDENKSLLWSLLKQVYLFSNYS